MLFPDAFDEFVVSVLFALLFSAFFVLSVLLLLFSLPLDISSLLDVTSTFLSDKYLLATYPVFPFTFIFDHVPSVSRTVTFVFTFN